VTLNIVDVEYL